MAFRGSAFGSRVPKFRVRFSVPGLEPVNSYPGTLEPRNRTVEPRNRTWNRGTVPGTVEPRNPNLPRIVPFPESPHARVTPCPQADPGFAAHSRRA